MSYVFEVYGPNGVQLIFTSSRGSRFLASGTTSDISHSNSVTVPFTGLVNDDNFQVFVTPNPDASLWNADSGHDLWTMTKSTDQFTITNNLGASMSFDYIIMRTG